MSLTNFLQKPLARALSGALASIASGGLWAGGSNWHYAQDTFDADTSPNKVLVSVAVAAAFGITVSQGGSVGMTVTGSDGNLTALAVGALPITHERGAAPNWLKDAGDLSQATWTKRGAATAAAGTLRSIGTNGVTMSLITVGALGVDDIYQTVTGYPASSRTEPGLWIERVSKSGVLRVMDPYNGTPSEWQVDLSKLPDRPTWVVRSHASVTIVREFQAAADGQCGMWFAASSGTVQAYVAPSQAPGTLPPAAHLRTFSAAPLSAAGTPLRQNLLANSGDLTQNSGGNSSSATATSNTITLGGASPGAQYYYTRAVAAKIVKGCVYSALVTFSGPAGRVIGWRICDASSGADKVTSVTCTGSSQTVRLRGVVADNASLGLEVGVENRNWIATGANGVAGDVFTVTEIDIFEGTADLTHTPTTGTAISVYPQAGRVDEALGSTNLWTYNTAHDNAVWNPTNITANAATAPDGTATAEVYSGSTIAGNYRFTSVTNGAAYTVSVYLKYVSGTGKVRVGSDQNGSATYAVIDLTTGSVSAKGASVTTADVEWIGAGWYRFKVTLNAPIANCPWIIYNDAASANSFAVWGSQLESGSVATPLIFTDSATATRSPTLVRYPSTWIGDGPQTVASCVVPSKAATGASQVLLGRGGSNNGPLYLSSTGAARTWDGTNVATTANTAADAVPCVLASRWSGAGIGVSLNGGSIVTSSFDGSMGSAAPVASGDDPTNGLGFRGLRKYDKTAPTAMNDTNFQLAAAGG